MVVVTPHIRAALAGAAALASTGALADFNDKKPVSFSVDGATATGYFKVVTESINGIVREAYPGTDATYKPGSPAGGVLNIATGKSDFTFNASPVEIAYANQGKAPFKEPLKGKFHYVMKLHEGLIVHNLMTKEWADKTGVSSFDDIAAKKPPMRLTVNLAANLQSTVTMYRTFFDAFGVNEGAVTDNGRNIIRGNSATGFDALRDGKVDVFINGGFVPTAEVADVARGRELRWISADGTKLAAEAAKWGLKTVTVPKSAYPFMTQDETTLAIWNAIVVGDHVPEETVYKFTKALMENEARVRSIHPSLAEFARAEAAKNITELGYHPGAARYYREAGFIK
ncbi:MAG: putative periplasmic binding protein [Hyphomicrobiales bacterium]|nr:putative periplasmic binding protein [Hyphomicrobiales bacterium]